MNCVVQRCQIQSYFIVCLGVRMFVCNFFSQREYRLKFHFFSFFFVFFVIDIFGKCNFVDFTIITATYNFHSILYWLLFVLNGVQFVTEKYRNPVFFWIAFFLFHSSISNFRLEYISGSMFHTFLSKTHRTHFLRPPIILVFLRSQENLFLTKKSSRSTL